jgi:hypothetical protein
MLGLSCLVPLLEAVNVFIKFSQGRGDFVTIVKICQANLFMTYSNPFTSYQHEHFQVFYDIANNNFGHITHNWVTNFNSGMETFFLVTPIKLTFFMQLLG